MVFVNVLINLNYLKYIEFILQLAIPKRLNYNITMHLSRQKTVINNGNMTQDK